VNNRVKFRSGIPTSVVFFWKLGSTMIKKVRWTSFRAGALVLLILAGCAAQVSHRDGLALMEHGRYEEAVAKLSEAAQRSPGDLEYRKDFVLAREKAAGRYISSGNEARIAERFDFAEQAYRQALRVEPGNGRALSGLEAVQVGRRHAQIVIAAEALLKKNNPEAAMARLREVFMESPNDAKALQLQRQINERLAKDLGASPTLSANFRKPVTLQFREANLKMVLESISKTSGINILLDKDVRADLKTTIFAQGTSVEDTINLILMQNQLEKKVLSDNTIFVYPNVPAKNKDYQELKVRSFHLVNADAKIVQTMLKTILKTRDLFINEKTNSIVMRDTPDAIELAAKMIADQDIAEPEIMLEVEVMEITHKLLSQLGIQYPDQLTFTPPGAAGGLSLSAVRSAYASATARNNLLVTPVPSLTLNAHLDTTNANLLASPRVRVRNREKAKILIGDRVPVLTNSVTPVATGAPVVTGSVSYIDVGLKLDVEPDIHSDGEVGIKVSMEVSNIVSQVTNPVSGTVAYQIGTRTASTVLRLKDGETQVLAGLISDNDTKTANGIPGLSQLPVLGRLFSTHGKNETKTEIVLSITPRIVGRTNQQDAQLMEYWSGTESSLRSAPVVLRQTGNVAMSSGTAIPAPVQGARPPITPAKQPASAASHAMLLSWEGPAQAKVGERFTLTLAAKADEAVRNLGMQISFDPATLKAVEAVEGSFMRQQQVTSTFTRDINQPAGQIVVELTGAGEQGAKGSGSIAAITFEVIAVSAKSEITLTRADSSGLTGAILEAASPPAHVVVLNP
jgi:general secretion pathway protein D